METLRTVEEIVAAARARGVPLVAARTRLDESGMDFLAAHAEDEAGAAWIVRVPRRPDVLERARAEDRALRLVRDRLSVVVPRWSVFTPELIAYRRVEGEPAAVVDPAAGGYVWRFDEGSPPDAFVDSLAHAIAEIHRINAAEAREAGVPVHEPAEVRTLAAERVERAREDLEVPDPVWNRWRRWLDDDTLWPDRVALIHGDLHPAHLLVDDEHRVTGILDWTEARVGDPAADFVIQYATLGRDALHALLHRYREAGGPVWPRIADHIVESWAAYPATIAEFARVSGDDGPLHLARHLIQASDA